MLKAKFCYDVYPIRPTETVGNYDNQSQKTEIDYK